MTDWAKEADREEQAILAKLKQVGLQNPSGDSASSTTESSASNLQTKPSPQPDSSAQASQTPESPQEPSTIPSQPASDTTTPLQTNTPDSKASQAATNDGNTEKLLSLEEQSMLNKLLNVRLVNSTANVEVRNVDPKSPLYSCKSFEELKLRPELLRGIYDMGFIRPSKIQETALPLLLAEQPRNIIAQSQSGTGKTAAFVLTMLSRLDPSQNYPQCLCLAPTYELARQIGDNVRQMTKFYPAVHVALAVKMSEDFMPQQTAQVVIGTPGTVLDWLQKRCFNPKMLKVFCFDEADVMIATQGHQEQSLRIKRQLPPAIQTLLFSATYSDDVKHFAHKVVLNPIELFLKREEETLSNIRQTFVLTPTIEEKYKALSIIYGTISIGQCMIFCRTRATAYSLAEKMSKEGHQVGLLAGDMDVSMRAQIIDRFREAKEKVLITTNVSARGIDIEQVTVVVNFDLPDLPDGQPDFETYLHRIGRTGRFGRLGIAINMIDTANNIMLLKQIQDHFGTTITQLDVSDPDKIEALLKP